MPSLTKEDLNLLGDRFDSRLRAAVQDIIGHFNKSQGEQNIRLDKVDSRLGTMDDRLNKMDAKLEAIMEMLATRKELRLLIKELKAQGIRVDESKIIVV